MTSFSITDLSIPTETGPITFTRAYSTFNARDVVSNDLPAGVLSPGWFHNYEVRLILSGSGSEEGKALLQTPGGSRIGFVESVGKYSLNPGRAGR